MLSVFHKGIYENDRTRRNFFHLLLYDAKIDNTS